MAIVTKSDIQNGKNRIQEISFDKLGGELKIRPLTDGEISEIEAMMQNAGVQPITVKVKPGMTENDRNEAAKEAKKDMDVTVDPLGSAEGRYDADVKSVFYALQHAEDTENWTKEDIKGWPAGSVKEVALKVYEISGIDDPNETRKKVKDFREGEQESSDSSMQSS